MLIHLLRPRTSMLAIPSRPSELAQYDSGPNPWWHKSSSQACFFNRPETVQNFVLQHGSGGYQTKSMLTSAIRSDYQRALALQQYYSNMSDLDEFFVFAWCISIWGGDMLVEMLVEDVLCCWHAKPPVWFSHNLPFLAINRSSLL